MIRWMRRHESTRIEESIRVELEIVIEWYRVLKSSFGQRNGWNFSWRSSDSRESSNERADGNNGEMHGGIA